MRCCTAWNFASGRPNCSRDVACSMHKASAWSRAAQTWMERTRADFNRSCDTSSSEIGAPSSAAMSTATVSRGSPIMLAPAVIVIWSAPTSATACPSPAGCTTTTRWACDAHGTPIAVPCSSTTATVRTAASAGSPAACNSQQARRSCSANGIRTPWRTTTVSSSAASRHPAPLPPDSSEPVSRTRPRSSSRRHRSASSATSAGRSEAAYSANTASIMSVRAGSTSAIVIAVPIPVRSHRVTLRSCPLAT